MAPVLEKKEVQVLLINRVPLGDQSEVIHKRNHCWVVLGFIRNSEVGQET